MSKRSDMNVDLAYPPGWVQLPVGLSKKLERDKDLDTWAAGTAREMLAGAPAEQVTERARQLTHLTVSCRARKDRSGLAFYPVSAEGLVALLDVKSYGPDREHPVITLDLLEEIYGKASADTVGDIETSKVDLPSGPAVRVRSKRIEEPDPAGQGTLIEGVTYAIRPPGFDSAVVTTMTWTVLQMGDQLAAMADAIAKTVLVSCRGSRLPKGARAARLVDTVARSAMLRSSTRFFLSSAPSPHVQGASRWTAVNAISRQAFALSGKDAGSPLLHWLAGGRQGEGASQVAFERAVAKLQLDVELAAGGFVGL